MWWKCLLLNTFTDLVIKEHCMRDEDVVRIHTHMLTHLWNRIMLWVTCLAVLSFISTACSTTCLSSKITYLKTFQSTTDVKKTIVSVRVKNSTVHARGNCLSIRVASNHSSSIFLAKWYFSLRWDIISKANCRGLKHFNRFLQLPKVYKMSGISAEQSKPSTCQRRISVYHINDRKTITL